MMDLFTENLLKYLAVIAPVVGSVIWLAKKLDRLWRAINKIDKHKISYKQCEKRRAACRRACTRKRHP